MEGTIDKTKELATGEIRHLLWVYALPAVVSQIIASIYNIADRMFIGNGIGPLAIAGLAITMPVMNIIHAFGSLIGAGSAARMSIVLGKRDKEWAENILGNSFIYTFILGGIVMFFGYMFMNSILRKFGATDDTVSYALEYMRIVLPGMFMTTLTFNLVGLIRSSGYPVKSMLILAGGAILNIILDPLFIFVFKAGIGGAAWATTISMTVSSIAAIIHFVNPKSFIHFRRHAWRLKGYILRNILLIGMSPFLMNVAAAGVVAILNSQILRYGGDYAVGAYGISNSFVMLFILLIVGICMGMQPIAGYNYGAGLSSRLKEVYKLTMKWNVAIGIVGAVIACVFPYYIVRAFTDDATTIAIAIPCLRILIVMAPFIAFTITNSNFFQSIDKPWIAIVTSLSRQVIFLVPLCYIVPSIITKYGGDGLIGVWESCMISDICGAALAAILLYSQRKVFRENEPVQN
ncbi:MAG: MATE family efflux transporter [Bacteroidales bacterium]|nr:MATE family efflux transporter [Bacteroidales bacterium]